MNTIYLDHHKKKQAIMHDILVSLNLPNIADRKNISNNDLKEIRKLNDMHIDDLKMMAKIWNIKNYGTIKRRFNIYHLKKWKVIQWRWIQRTHQKYLH